MTAISTSNPARWSRPAVVFAMVGLVLPPLGVLAPLGLAPLLAAAALAVLLIDWRGAFRAFRTFAAIAVLLGALSLWAMLSAAWSILPMHSFLEGLRLLAISAGGLVCLGAVGTFEPRDRARVGGAAALGVALAAMLLITARFIDLELFRPVLSRAPDFPLTRFDRGATVLALAFWPAFAWSSARKTLAIALALAAALGIFALVSAAAKLALVAGAVCLGAGYRWPKLVGGVLAAAVILIAVLLPIKTPSNDGVVALHHSAPWIKPSGIHRLLIWRFAADRIAERPLLGWGMDASRELPGAQRSVADVAPASDLPGNAVLLPLHPHDAELQWRLELGVPGLVLCLLIVLSALSRAARAAMVSPLQGGANLAWGGAGLVIALLSYGAWQAWWLSCVWLTAALCRSVSSGDGAATRG